MVTDFRERYLPYQDHTFSFLHVGDVEIPSSCHVEALELVGFISVNCPGNQETVRKIDIEVSRSGYGDQLRPVMNWIRKGN